MIAPPMGETFENSIDAALVRTVAWCASPHAGKFDVLVGDSLFLFELMPRIDEATARRQSAIYDRKVQELQQHPGKREGASEAEYVKYTTALQKVIDEYARYVRTEHVGSVWLFRQK